MINVVCYSDGQDTGGQGYRIKQAFDRYKPEFRVRSIHCSGNYMQYPSDIVYTPQIAYELFKDADVIHMRQQIGTLPRLHKLAPPGKPYGLVLHHHGTRFRDNHRSLAVEARSERAIQLAATVDLTLLEPEVDWLPSPFDLDALREKAVPYALKGSTLTGTIRVAHAPTNRIVKSTATVIEAVRSLHQDDHLKIQLDLIERQTWSETLRRKGKADVYVDQLILGYGNNAIEAWAMGLPVVAGVADPAVRVAMLDHWGYIPFYEATEANLLEKLGELATDPALRAHWGKIGYDHVRRFHDERVVADSLAQYYLTSIRIRRGYNGKA